MPIKIYADFRLPLRRVVSMQSKGVVLLKAAIGNRMAEVTKDGLFRYGYKYVWNLEAFKG